MDQSIFTDKKSMPDDSQLAKALGKTFNYWQQISDLVSKKYADAVYEWSYPGEKYGWSFRIKDRKRVIIYLLPRESFFKVAFVFGQKATDEILASKVTDAIKTELLNAKVYAEGRGIRIDVKDKKVLTDIAILVSIKIKN